jgi:proline dehydrogenase
MSSRFVPGTTVEQVMAAARSMNDQGLTVSIDYLGENVSNAEEARGSAAVYHRLLDEITARGLKANVSLKLTHMGLDVDEKLAYDNVGALVAQAARCHNFVRVDMEGSLYTQRTLELVRSLHRLPGNEDSIGAVIQSYLRRSQADVEQLIAERIRIRLCKGAYKEPPEIAFQKKSEVDDNFVKLMKMLLTSGVYHGIATHDPRMIQATKDFARAEKIPPDAYEIQMLYGIRRDLQQQLVRDGYRMRVYIPFGTEWYPYFMRRLAERPANVFFVAKNIFRQ